MRAMVCLPPARATLQAALQQARQGESGLLALLEGCCDRMEAHEPHVRALLPEADRRHRLLAAARALTGPGRERPLSGLLLGVKDIIAAEGFPTRCGSMIPHEAHGLPSDSVVVRRLREAGAIVAGKTVTTEFANKDPGPTANPWDTAHTPGGSSSGSAAAVAAGMIHIALGTQTIGSVARPASFCGICGYKPSYGRVPSEGVAVYSPSIDTVGFYTPDAAGMHLVASVAVDHWDSARFSAAAASARPPVLGVPEGGYLRAFAPESLAAFEEALADLAGAGVVVRRVPGVMEDVEAVAGRHVDLTRAEWAQSLSGQWKSYSSLFRSKSAMEMVAGLATPSEAILNGRKCRGKLRAELERAMEAADVDFWVTPGALQGSAPLGLDSTGDSLAQLPWSHSGLPTLSLPAGLDMRLPR
eukprot:CAMPEP_0177432390 /NCGR_PEP_ID=MMETSP0368-20130122/76669_1 /TAXON_ID=447022 ORGANISM="Scrippsiella hangoei-like, Strain SHHI-4" /NCGR_SAMPLE_ID=MMETSP0368 /ASSEMBLY_ACC=CAM_ASM_000363 /LENGTH=414 /DNA_ID=CAMNT_0018903057 /DNA_START=56 /DNA_END=1297 /DNA_ORIENTATION=+